MMIKEKTMLKTMMKKNKAYVFLAIAIILMAVIILVLSISDSVSDTQSNDLNSTNISSVIVNESSNTTLQDENGTFTTPKMVHNPFEMPSSKPPKDDEKENSNDSQNLIPNSTNIIEFLNKIKPEIIFNPNELSFGYSQKVYKLGDKFLNEYEIIKITPNFIRFRIDDYEYNLRFVEK